MRKFCGAPNTFLIICRVSSLCSSSNWLFFIFYQRNGLQVIRHVVYKAGYSVLSALRVESIEPQSLFAELP